MMMWDYTYKHLIYCWMILLLECKVSSGFFQVLGPDYPLSAVIGEDLVLPCSLKPSMSAEEDTTVEWFRLNRHKQGSLVHLYKEGRVQNDKQIQAYKGRTSLFEDKLKTGNTSLKLSSVQVSDDGDYKCFIQIGSHYDDVFVHVFVRGIGQAPLITPEGIRKDGGFTLVCESEGWWPEPVLEWLDRKGRLLTAEPPETVLGPNGVRVKRRLVAYNGNQYVCRLTQQDARVAFEKLVVMEATFHISDGVFTQPWKIPFIASLSFLLSCFVLGPTTYYTRKSWRKKSRKALRDKPAEPAEMETRNPADMECGEGPRAITAEKDTKCRETLEQGEGSRATPSEKDTTCQVAMEQGEVSGLGDRPAEKDTKCQADVEFDQGDKPAEEDTKSQPAMECGKGRREITGEGTTGREERSFAASVRSHLSNSLNSVVSWCQGNLQS
ncbi:butyrophilin subfamily 3 member A2-like isoform X2 [Sardina pilchardus]|uniref:butyrophilin subfamily 3 member A2-like isoform X2 n=1 Tax=Sardina pilchardus TaxID=27697 RepID=UPI002E1086EB